MQAPRLNRTGDLTIDQCIIIGKLTYAIKKARDICGPRSCRTRAVPPAAKSPRLPGGFANEPGVVSLANPKGLFCGEILISKL